MAGRVPKLCHGTVTQERSGIVRTLDITRSPEPRVTQETESRSLSEVRTTGNSKSTSVRTLDTHRRLSKGVRGSDTLPAAWARSANLQTYGQRVSEAFVRRTPP